jgi:RNA polymerase sigma factor (sigma-70 family)
MTTSTCRQTDVRSSGRRSFAPDAADVGTLVAQAVQGDSAAWTELIRRHENILHGTARRFRLSREEHDDAVQRTWQRTVEHLCDLRNAAALPGWLATSMRRECLAMLRARVREAPAGDMSDHDARTDQPDVVDVVISSQEAQALHRAVEELPSPQRALIRALLETPIPSYAEISHRLNMPIGSIGPIRGRALQRLAAALAPSTGV